MPFELQTTGDHEDLILAGSLGVRQAQELWDALQPAMVAGRSIQLQAERLNEMDTSIIQILLLLRARSGQFQVGGTSEGFLAALRARGLETLFVRSPALQAKTAQVQPEILAKSAGQGHG